MSFLSESNYVCQLRRLCVSVSLSELCSCSRNRSIFGYLVQSENLELKHVHSGGLLHEKRPSEVYSYCKSYQDQLSLLNTPSVLRSQVEKYRLDTVDYSWVRD